MTAEEFAAKLLADNGCNEHTYCGAFGAQLMKDLKNEFPDGMPEPFTYLEIANAILSMSRPEPIERAPFKVMWGNGGGCGSIARDTLESAIETAESVLAGWIVQEQAGWESDVPTQTEADDFNYMIDNCSANVWEYDPKKDTYRPLWEPPDDLLESIGWVEISAQNVGAATRRPQNEPGNIGEWET